LKYHEPKKVGHQQPKCSHIYDKKMIPCIYQNVGGPVFFKRGGDGQPVQWGQCAGFEPVFAQTKKCSGVFFTYIAYRTRVVRYIEPDF